MFVPRSVPRGAPLAPLRFMRLYSVTSPSVAALLSAHNIETAAADFQHDYNEPLLSHLRRRGLVETCVNEETLAKLADGSSPLGLYCGADPTARSLHLGNLLPLMVLLHFNLRGHNVFPLVGGATGAVGDPSGRATERDAMAQQTRLDNVARISSQLSSFFERAIQYGKSRNSHIAQLQPGTTTLQNNYSWWHDMPMLQFLALYGKHIRVNQMLSRDSIKSRIESAAGIGFNEFTYQILQAYDFYHLNKTRGVDIQVGGNDQYGNIVAGIDLISRLRKTEESAKSSPVFGITVPLLTTSNGVKFGKSAGNAIFIDKALTSSYNVYQFMYNTVDEDVHRFLYKFSLLPTKIIDRVVAAHAADPSQRLGQRLLALEMCDLIHGDGEGDNNFVISEVLFGKKDVRGNFTAEQLLAAFHSQGMVHQLPRNELLQTSLLNLVHKCCGGTKSKSELRRMVKAGSVYLGNTKTHKVADPEATVDTAQLLDDKVLLIRVGKQFHVLESV